MLLKVLFSISVISVLCYSVSANVKSCFKCSDDNCIRINQVNETEVCTGTADTCTTIFKKYQPIKKGCYSGLSAEAQLICDSNESYDCYKCSTDNCNYLGRLDHTCSSCTSLNNPSCLNNPIENELRCNAPLVTDAYCFTQILENVTTRGCVDTYTEMHACLNNTNCVLCNVTKNGVCNVDEFPVGRRKCIHCIDSNNGQVCGTNTATSSYCDNVDDTCTIMNLGKNIFKQMCTKNMNNTDLEFCTKYNTSCITCTNDNDCNTVLPKAPSAGTYISSSTVNISLLLVSCLIYGIWKE